MKNKGILIYSSCSVLKESISEIINETQKKTESCDGVASFDESIFDINSVSSCAEILKLLEEYALCVMELDEHLESNIFECLKQVFQIDSFVQVIIIINSQTDLQKLKLSLPQESLNNVLIINNNASDIILRQSLIIMLEKYKLSKLLRDSEVLNLTGAMTAGVAHDFNNIIGGVYSTATYMKYLIDKEDNIEVLKKAFKDNLEAIERSSIQGTAMVESLLAFSKTGNITKNMSDLNELIANSIKLSKYMLPDTVNISFSPFSLFEPKIELVESLFQQALLNLIINASDAMTIMKEDGAGGEIKISLTRISISEPNSNAWRAGDYFYLSISDTGVGIPEKIKQKIFEPYFTLKSSGNGFGLGLTVVREFISQHNCYLEIDSKVGEGTEFLIFIPVNTKKA